MKDPNVVKPIIVGETQSSIAVRVGNLFYVQSKQKTQ